MTPEVKEKKSLSWFRRPTSASKIDACARTALEQQCLAQRQNDLGR